MTTRQIWMTLAITLLIPAQSRAQAAATAPSFGDLQRILKVGDRVKVTDEKGTTREGRVTAISASSLALREKGTDTPCAAARRSNCTVEELAAEARATWTSTEKTVTKIQRTDPVSNGTLIGFAPGAVGMVAFGVINHASGGGGSEGAGIVGGGLFLAALAGAGIGAVVDRLIGNEVVYRAPSPAGQAKLVVSPLLGRHSAGVSLSLRF